MNCTLLGFKSVNFENNDGEKIEGLKIFYSYPEENTCGEAADSSFVRPSVFDSFSVNVEQLADNIGCVMDFEFDRKGKLVGLSIA